MHILVFSNFSNLLLENVFNFLLGISIISIQLYQFKNMLTFAFLWRHNSCRWTSQWLREWQWRASCRPDCWSCSAESCTFRQFGGRRFARWNSSSTRTSSRKLPKIYKKKMHFLIKIKAFLILLFGCMIRHENSSLRILFLTYEKLK